MKIFALPWGMFALLLFLIVSPIEAYDGQMIRGNDFEGMIATPAMLEEDFSHCEGSIFSTGLWTPSPALVRQAERQLPHALAQSTPPPKILSSYYVPAFYTPKGARPVARPGHERLESDLADSDEDSVLYEVRPILSDYKRQYLGVTLKGKKYLFMSFVHVAVISSDPYAKKLWGHGWVDALDGGTLLWSVLYDPVNGTFGDWI